MRIEEVKRLLFSRFGANRINIIIPAENMWVVSIDGEDQPSVVNGTVIRGLNESDEHDARLLSVARNNFAMGNFY